MHKDILAHMKEIAHDNIKNKDTKSDFIFHADTGGEGDKLMSIGEEFELCFNWKSL